MRIRSKDPMVLVTAPVPGDVQVTEIDDGSGGGGDGDTDTDIDLDEDDFDDANDTLVDDEFDDSLNETESEYDDYGDAYGGDPPASPTPSTHSGRFGGDRGSWAGEKYPRAVPSPPAWVHQRVMVDKVGNGTITGNVQGVFDWPLLGTLVTVSFLLRSLACY